MTGPDELAGGRPLVVEDECFPADDPVRGPMARGAEVVGPVGDDALDLVKAGGAWTGRG